ncbi:MAG: tRNA 2-thiouridine(34) synthase MnmA [Gemmatimonadota bacterium]|nr:MAG: tRNA 2-thiouridine(34) synthase MnmA [Gemmatimonadota bacterium]
MSGGVDSSLAAVLLQQQGFEVIGVTMHLWDYGTSGGNIGSDTACCSVEAMSDARTLCQSWNIPHYVLDLRAEFEKEVITDFVSEYLSGRTPNPCVICNQKMKWEALWTKAKQLGASFLATGHYAQIETDAKNERYLLKRGTDERKDQSYFLWILTQHQLQHTLFPLGSMTKEEVRGLAKKHHLKVAEKGDSQEICFIPDNNYRRFFQDLAQGNRLKIRSIKEMSTVPAMSTGPIKYRSGEIIGEHSGYPFYTVGQRKGLGIAAGRPLYVTRIDPSENAVYVGSEEDLYCQTLSATHLNWIAIPHLKEPLRCTAKIRYRHHPAKTLVNPIIDDRISLHFDEPQRAITPGQSVVLYNGDVVIGGGIIDNAATAA